MSVSVISTLLYPAASGDLVDLATAKDELLLASGDTQHDAFLARAIRQTTAVIENYCNRAFAPALLQDQFDLDRDPYPYQTPEGVEELVLSRHPVLALISAVQVNAGVTSTLTPDVDFRLDAASGKLTRLDRWTGAPSAWDAAPVTVIYVGGCGAAMSEVHGVPGTPYQVTLNGVESFSCDIAVTDSTGTAFTRITGAPAAGQYSVIAGVYQFAAADLGKSLTIRFASKIIPDDLAQACLQTVTERHWSRGRDPAMVSRETPGIGVERWWIGAAPGQKGPFPPNVAALLDPYRNSVMA